MKKKAKADSGFIGEKGFIQNNRRKKPSNNNKVADIFCK